MFTTQIKRLHPVSDVICSQLHVILLWLLSNRVCALILMSWFMHQKKFDKPVICGFKGWLLKYAAAKPRFCHPGMATQCWLLNYHGVVGFHSMFLLCELWDGPVLLTGSKHSTVPLTLEGTLKTVSCFLLLQRFHCFDSNMQGLPTSYFLQAFFHGCCSWPFQLFAFICAAHRFLLFCFFPDYFNLSYTHTTQPPKEIELTVLTAIPDLMWGFSVLVSFSAGYNVFHLILGSCPKNSSNLCPNGTILLFNADLTGRGCRYLCPFTSPTQY